MKKQDVRKKVREGYAKVAVSGSGCCGSASEDIGRKIGYSKRELSSVPEGANLGLGCGNPTALASLKKGDIVLDLGSGAGFDCFLSSERVGKKGRVIGVDMTPEMLEKARENARRSGYKNVEFRLGEIENLPVADNSVDVIISNCVINLSPYKERVFAEAFRVLRPGGRIMVSDLVLAKKLPLKVKKSVAAYVACVSGAVLRDEYLKMIKAAGFSGVRVLKESPFSLDCIADLAGRDVAGLGNSVVSVQVSAEKKQGSKGMGIWEAVRVT